LRSSQKIVSETSRHRGIRRSDWSASVSLALRLQPGRLRSSQKRETIRHHGDSKI
jgi:hypothetical protein